MIAKRIPEGGLFPFGYGVGWYEWYTREAVCYPVPLNLLLRWVRMAWIWMRSHSGVEYITVQDHLAIVHQECNKGYDAGVMRGMIPEYQRDHYRKLFGMEPEEFFRLAEKGQIVPIPSTQKEEAHVERGHS